MRERNRTRPRALQSTTLGVAITTAISVALGVAGCGAASEESEHEKPRATTTPPAPTQSITTDAAQVDPLPAGAFDYQLGGAYEPPVDVAIVVRDRSDAPDPTKYSICYVNGFQTQPEELDAWPKELLLHDDSGVIADPDWPDEVLLDTSTAETRAGILAVVTPWIQGCAESGFNAVEFDNLDTYTRSNGALTLNDNLELAAAYVRAAHDAGLAAGQKNAAEDAAPLHDQAAFDFAISEECAAYNECDAYASVYGDDVLDIEYTDALPRSFEAMCNDPDSPTRVILRDRDLVLPTDPEYTFQLCG